MLSVVFVLVTLIVFQLLQPGDQAGSNTWITLKSCNQVKADPRSTYVCCLRVVRRSRVGVRRSSVNLTFWLCCYFLVDSSLRQHCNTSRDWQWLGEIPCQIYIPESRTWIFPFVCKITRTGRSLPKFPSPQHFGRILQAEGEISATQVYKR